MVNSGSLGKTIDKPTQLFVPQPRSVISMVYMLAVIRRRRLIYVGLQI